MSVSVEDVKYIARLARLELPQQEAQKMTEQMNQILDYMEQLNQVDTSQVEPLAHPLEMKNVFREDRQQPSLQRDQALKNAPKKAADAYFSVPKVVKR